MKIYFRYLFMRLFQVFTMVLVAMALIWIMVDLYGNIDDFLEHKIDLRRILLFYVWNIPRMLVLVLPAALLFSMLFTMLGLNRRSELVAFQSGGMAPLILFAPFFLFAALCVAALAYDMHAPAAIADVTRDRLLRQIKGESAGRNDLTTLINLDVIHHKDWYIENLNTRTGEAQKITVTDMNDQWEDERTYAANTGQWTGDSWRLSNGVAKIPYAPGNIPGDRKQYGTVDLDISTPPQELALNHSEPAQLTVPQLEQYINTQPDSSKLAYYRTEWWYRVLYPLCLPVLMLFALRQGAQIDRRNTLAGVALAIVVFFSFNFSMYVFRAVGEHGHMPPYAAIGITEVIFGLIGLHLLALNNGWWWQLGQRWNKGRTSPVAPGKRS
ncbi:MAG TPA: LptF/LptG family permease [Candidatus Methylacidiphilales bacterium]|nr:LptF/LptG family permease [Candidatus Methylacidiphilales bacterium]